MKLHSTTIDRLISVYETYGGYKNETKLKNKLAEFDLSEYKRASGESILVLSSDLAREAGEQG